jgi:4'-phosphopantetheinyl transferase
VRARENTPIIGPRIEVEKQCAPGALLPRHVHLWDVALDRDAIGAAAALLSPAEQDRAGRFRFADDRRRFTLAHAALRLLIGSYLDTEPRLVELEQPREHGKPGVVRSELEFSMSHAGERALVAISPRSRVGVDVELVCRLPEAAALARAHFTEREQRHLTRAADQRELLRLWTRKEALLKATGEGLSRALKELDVLDPDPIPGLRLVDLAPEPGYVAAVAVAADTERIVTAIYEWEQK